MSVSRGAPSALLAALLVACGSNRPELPAGLGQAESCVSPGYPGAPYGTEPGGVLKNACFQGFRAPERSTHDESALEPIALSDFYDPDGSRGIEIVLINTAAVWCSACRVEHEHLPDYATRFGPRGLAMFSALFQDQERNPATLSDLTNWVDTFGSNFPMALDPDYVFGRYASAETAPLNLVVDARTMTILEKYIGDQSAVMWPFIESRLRP